jgi:SAM-dependent methyltransferase
MSKSEILGLNPKIWSRVKNFEPNLYAHKFISENILTMKPNETLVDIGCGTQPYKKLIIEQGVHYTAQDFGQYIPNNNPNYYGLHDKLSEKVNLDLVCDLLDIPEKKYDYVLLTEVLEHVPDPVKALNKVSKLIKPTGTILITVPGMSWTHQAPYYFSSGLSPFWFEHHARQLGLTILEGLLIGDLYQTVIYATRTLEYTNANLMFRLLGKIYRFFMHYLVSERNLQFYDAPVNQICVKLKYIKM